MYSPPTGPLPITGIDVLGIALAGGCLMIAGLLLLRLAYFQRKRKAN